MPRNSTPKVIRTTNCHDLWSTRVFQLSRSSDRRRSGSTSIAENTPTRMGLRVPIAEMAALVTAFLKNMVAFKLHPSLIVPIVNAI